MRIGVPIRLGLVLVLRKSRVLLQRVTHVILLELIDKVLHDLSAARDTVLG